MSIKTVLESLGTDDYSVNVGIINDSGNSVKSKIAEMRGLLTNKNLSGFEINEQYKILAAQLKIQLVAFKEVLSSVKVSIGSMKPTIDQAKLDIIQIANDSAVVMKTYKDEMKSKESEMDVLFNPVRDKIAEATINAFSA